MSKKQKKQFLKRKLFLLITLLVFLFSIIKVGNSLATTDTFTITNAEISDKSSTVDVNNFSFEKCKIINDVIFHQVGDSITYKITVKNNDDKDYTIKTVKDNNTSEFISYIYDGYEGTKFNSKEETTFEVTEKYIAESPISDRNQNLSVNIIFTLEDENGNVIDTTIPINTSSNPKTGDSVGVYISIASISFIMLIFLLRENSRIIRSSTRVYKSTIDNNIQSNRSGKRNNKTRHGGKGFKFFSLFIVGALLLPTISKAVTNYDLAITFENKIVLKDKLVISYTVSDRNYEIITPYNTQIEGLNAPEIPGYEFDKWEDESGNEFNPDIPVTNDVKITAKYTLIPYTISYDLKDGCLEDEKINPTTYTVETANIELNKPTKEAYTFEGWTGTELPGKIENVIIEKGSTGNREYTANWVPTEYSIIYNLNGGTAIENPTKYTIETDDIVLNQPTKEGYTFEGWTGTEQTEKTTDLTITKGSTGNREYTANWTPTNYTITYTGLTEDEENELNNPTIYNIETPSTTLNNPQDRRDSDNDITEKFVGWKENTTVSTNITIPADLGIKEYEAVWVTVDPNIYTITYNLNGGTVDTENRTSFTKFDTFTISNPTKRGYDFVGWTGSNGTTPETTVVVSTGTRDNLEYEANWTPIEYTITYNLNDGTVTENPTTYTIETSSFTLNNPSKTGYTFKGWSGTGLIGDTNTTVIIDSGSTESREYTANYTANKYYIKFNSNGGSGSMENQTMTYDISSNLTANNFTNPGYSLDGWNTQEDGNGTSYSDCQSVINLTSTNNEIINLYAQWAPDYLNVMSASNGETIAAFDNNLGITKAQVEKVYTLNTLDLPSNLQASVKKQWDVSEKQNGSIIAYALDTDSNSKYEVYIGQDGGVKANPNSKKLFNYYSNATYMDLSNLITDDVTTMVAMFQACGKLKDIEGEENWKTDNVELLSATFNNCTSLTSLDVSNFKTENVTDMQQLFGGCSSLTNLDLSSFDTKNVTSMFGMFIQCSKITDLNLSNFNTEKVTDMSGMFFNCSKLTNVNLSSFNTENVTTMLAMFDNCTKIASLNISNFDTRKVTDMSYMFAIDGDVYDAGGRSSLTNIVFGENFKTDNVTTMEAMFQYCNKMANIDVSTWNTSKVTNMNCMFNGCSALTSLNVSDWNTPQLTSCYFMFNKCSKLTNMDLSDWDMSKITNNKAMFQYCTGLKNIIMPNNYTRIDSFAFNHNSAYNQEKFTIPAGVKTVGKSHIFYNFGTTNFKKFEVEEENTEVKTIDDILYSYDGTRLINIPMGKAFENNRFELPEGITFLNELSFSRNKNIKTLVLPNSYEIERFINRDNNSYGFINSGSSLNVAVYLFTSISEYEVKSDNPRYSSFEGCIYSKDGTELIAIPLHYSGTLNIKEGTTKIGQEAIWAGETDAVDHVDSLTEINIPASVTTIEENQITVLNKLAKKGVTINIDSENTAYEMSNNTIVAK